MPETLPNKNIHSESSLALGATAVEVSVAGESARTLSIAELRSDLDSYATELSQRSENEAPADLQTEARAGLSERQVVKMLEQGDYSADDLEGLLTSIHGIDKAIGGATFGWQCIDAAEPTILEVLSRRPGILDTMVDRAVDSGDWQKSDQSYKNLVETAERATQGRFGTIDRWRKEGQVVPATPAIEKLASDPRLPLAYLNITRERVEQGRMSNNGIKMYQLRSTEQILLRDLIGMPPEMASDIRQAIEGRTMLRRDGKIVPLEKNGGINVPGWHKTILHTVEAVQQLGVEGVQQLYKKCGIVNLDRYTPEQLNRMRALLQGDPNFLDHLQKSNVRVVFSDGPGDHNGAIGQGIQEFETKDGTTLYFELNQVSDIYRHFITLRNLGVKPSSLVLGLHGNIGFMRAGPDDKSTYIIDRAGSFRGKKTKRVTLGIRDSHVGRLFGEFMQPDKETGEREVVLLSCRQAATSRWKKIKQSNAELLALMSDPEDNVLVYAGEKILNVRHGAEGLEFVDTTANTLLPAIVYSVQSREQRPGWRARARGKAGKAVTTKVVTKQVTRNFGRKAA